VATVSTLSLRGAEFSLVEAEYRRHSAKPGRQSSFILLYSQSISPTYFLVRNNRVLGITMSFGFSVGDFVVVLKLVNVVRERCIGAPKQFKAISNE
jgi:hypothetical protein